MIRRFSPAKLNLLLRVGTRMASGYHRLETVMVPVSLGDWLAVRPQAHGVTLEITERYDFSGTSDAVSCVPTGDHNLIVRMAKGFLAHHGISTGVHFILHKSIPAGGGLGGASSNGATALLLLNELFQLERPWRELAEFSADYGSDIGFFTQPYAAICQGRGEIVTPFPSPNVGWFTIVRPPFGLSTPAVFAEYSKENPQNFRIEAQLEGEIRYFSGFLSKGQLRCWAIIAANDLQRPAISLKEELVTLSACCAVNRPLAQLLTGSGSCWYSVFQNRRQAVWAANRLRGRKVGRVEIAKSIAAAF